MLNKKAILDLIGFDGVCNYNKLQEIHDDPDLLFSKDQRLQLESLKCIARDIATLKNIDCNNGGDSDA
jgi:hypothetical protein